MPVSYTHLDVYKRQMLAGYLVGLAVIPRFVSQERYLAISATLGVLFALGALLTHGCLLYTSRCV